MNMGKITQFTFVLVIAALVVGLSACDELASLLSTDEEIDNVTPETHVIADLPVENISVRILEIYPVQIDLVVEGILTDNCTTIYQTTQRREGDTVHVHITTKRPKDLACAAVISPIEVSVQLEGIFEPGKYKLIVNGVEELFEVF